MKLSKIAGAGLIATGLTVGACSEGAGPKETLGTLGGAVLGGLAGAQVGGGSGQLAATAAGALIGAVLGSEIGKSLDKADQLYAERTAQDALESTPSNQTSQWSNPDSGNSGTVTPTETFQTTDGRYCREYQTTVTVGGETQDAYGTACRQPDGTWEIQS
jgi:surface antigen